MIRDETKDTERNVGKSAVLLIAHGSRRPEANCDLEYVAAELRRRGYELVECSYLEIAEPDVITGGARCVAAGATQVILLPYFLSAGMHAAVDLESLRATLAANHPGARFTLAQPLGRDPLLVDVVEARIRRQAEAW